MRDAKQILIAVYIAVGIATYGKAYNEEPPPKTQFGNHRIEATAAGLAAGLVWPLYWSAVTWEKP